MKVGVEGAFNCEYKRDGWYADEDFCHVYWRCNYGIAEEYECPAGTAWNHIENKCDWLDFVDCNRFELKKFTKGPEDEETEEPSKKDVQLTTLKATEEISETTAMHDETIHPDHTMSEMRTGMKNKFILKNNFEHFSLKFFFTFFPKFFLSIINT